MDTLDTCGCPYRNCLKYGVNRWNYLIIWAKSHRHNRILLNNVGKRFLSCLIPSFRGFLHRVGVATIALVGVLMHDEIHADSPESLIDEHCESYELTEAINLPIRRICLAERDACIDERISSLNESHDRAKEFCAKQPLGLDPYYVGPCPSYAEELEAAASDANESILPKINVRKRFRRLNDQGHTTSRTYKHDQSIHGLRQLLEKEPSNFVALRYLKSLLSVRGSAVEKLTLELKLHDLDQDCPNDRGWRTSSIYSQLNELVQNWVTETGAASEMSNRERRELFKRAWQATLDVYDIAVAQEQDTGKLFWGLVSVHDPVLTGRFDNIEYIAEPLEIELNDFSEERRKDLIRNLANEYGPNSKHGRTQALGMTCNDYAFELGLTAHCLKLLEHLGKKDARSLDSISTDWAQAAILLVNWLTRDCSANPLFQLDGPKLFDHFDKRCGAEDNESSIESIGSLVSLFHREGSGAEHELLRAYLSLDETSEEHFVKALGLDATIVPYGTRLSKRLFKRGEKGAAINILSNISPDQKLHLDVYEMNELKWLMDSIDDGSNIFFKDSHRIAF